MSGSGNVAVVPPEGRDRPPRRGRSPAPLFLLSALLLLGGWVVYPGLHTIPRGFFGREGFDEFVGIDNYKELFTDDSLVTAIKNNAIWVAVVPTLVTAIGLIFAVLLERVRWSVAFKTAVFMPMAISAFAAGVIWRITLEEDPDRGAANAAISVVADAVDPGGPLPRAVPSQKDRLVGSTKEGFTSRDPVAPGDVRPLG